jgi:transitional endoplasmic reticulum ATPase
MLATLLNEVDGVGHRPPPPPQTADAVNASNAATARDARVVPYVLVVGTTNRPWALDAAVTRPGRLEEHVELPLPNEDDRRAILAARLASVPLDADVRMAALAAMSDGMTPAQLSAWCAEAVLAAVGDAIEARDSDGGLTNGSVRGAQDAPQQPPLAVTVCMAHFTSAGSSGSAVP